MAANFPVTTQFRVEGANETIATIGALWKSYREGDITLGAFNEGMKKAGEATLSQRHANMLLRTEWRVSHATLLEFNRALMDLAHMGQTILTIWSSWTLAQLRMERLTKDHTDAVIGVSEAQSLYNQYLRDFGADSVYTLEASDKLNTAKSREKDVLDQITKAQTDNIVGYVGMGLSAVGVIAQVTMLRMHLSTTAGTLASTTSALLISKLAWIAHAIATGASSVALAIFHALTGPLGWAILAVAAAVAVGAIAWIKYQESLSGATEAQQELNGNPINPSIPPEVYGTTGEGFQTGGIGVIRRTGYYKMHAGEPYAIGERYLERSSTREIGEVSIVNNFGDVTGNADVERAGEIMYRKFTEKLADKY